MGDQQSWDKRVQPALCRILDANLDRAREGLRIVEEWCRFGLDSAELSQECKKLRQELAQWHTMELRLARDTPGDLGTELSHPQEEKREGIDSVLQANLCRIEEALRVLEEYGKIYHPDMGVSFKQMRYRVYTLESRLLAYRRYQLLNDAYLYLVTSTSDQMFSIVEAALQGGLKLVQYRDKQSDDETRLQNCEKLCELTHRYDALFIVNDRVDLAIASNADGVHLGQKDIPISLARQLLGPQQIIGRSTTNPEEMQAAIEQGADYIGVGPVYKTPTKADKPAAGLNYVRHAAENCEIPWFAIGGIDMNNFEDVMSVGGERIAVVRAIMQAEQPTLVTQYFLSQLTRIQTLRTYNILPNPSSN